MTPLTLPRTPELYVFTYGTLRPDMALHSMIRRSVITAETATVDGYALYANTSDSYPYLVPEEGTETTGTLYLIQNGRTFSGVHHMELGAGYDAAMVDAKLADGSTVQALAWEWRKAWGLGTRITSGDWCEYAASLDARWAAPVR
jgi:gamma-glutamylcyclotransferase (GGCT)/AIG2-like uncharacterized protein YtfP